MFNIRTLLLSTVLLFSWSTLIQISAQEAISFNNQEEFSIVNSPTSVSLADFNNDSLLDMAVAVGGPGSNSVAVMLRQADGEMQQTQYYTVGRLPSSVVAADLNNDGLMDIASANTSSNDISILLGIGQGLFQTAESYPVNSPTEIAIGDLNGDTVMDLVAISMYTDMVGILVGSANATFESAQYFSIGTSRTYAGSIALGDFNRDRRLDVVVANYLANSVSLLLGNGNGTLRTAKNIPVGQWPKAIAVGDFNNDSRLDIVTANAKSNDVSILLGQSGGRFRAVRNFAGVKDPRAISVGDINADGKLDVTTANYGSNDISIMLGNGDGTLIKPLSFAVGSRPRSVDIGDLDADGLMDVVAANGSSNSVTALFNSSDN
jgi:hypothetical protein